MNLRKVAILTLVVLLPLSLCAQKRKKRVLKKEPVIEVPQEDPRITNMREMTQQIVIIDSIVTDKEHFLTAFRLSSETGTLTTCQEFFGKSMEGYLFRNEMGNKIYFSLPDDSLRQQLYTSDKLGNEWSQAVPLQGISEGISEASFPFMLTDGVTFYFAGKGEESIGGYDIFLTRYDSRSNRFLKPENIGMPFNSEANDYMFAIDETNRIGYFVSDRRQPEDKVCVYVFIPADSRKTYDSSVYTEQQISDFANITSIADTWGDGKEREKALARMSSMNGKSNVSVDSPRRHTGVNPVFVVSDALTYSDASDFRSPKAASLYKQLISARKLQQDLEDRLGKSRDYYAKADSAERQALRQDMLRSEEELQRLNTRVKTLEKQIRNEEVKVIN
ncbi:hypothetical protein SAMN04487850_0044 [Prevotella aff. ruminicola Tc2-24]|uniref:WD40-like Beta Propeller Repeat n=1 Tax=Prevotella aff. ruminicola Tc2-24 TaxID=81582 RepID=A0A1I0LYH9_9BACT|nr:hypothetical protein [Prevotella aff. ruminicola Tc2-24]SEV80197.1 hypothetical protein SAMN04487850_0044 [Prevotella aff. ruminicola Tc2-24]